MLAVESFDKVLAQRVTQFRCRDELFNSEIPGEKNASPAVLTPERAHFICLFPLLAALTERLTSHSTPDIIVQGFKGQPFPTLGNSVKYVSVCQQITCGK